VVWRTGGDVVTEFLLNIVLGVYAIIGVFALGVILAFVFSDRL
jgi:hypothetical protein